MELTPDWLTRGLIDFEYKKYLLLAYLKEARHSFDRVELFPFFGELLFHYRNLVELKEKKTLMHDAFPRELSLDDMKRLELGYRQIVADDALMEELESIIAFAVPEMKKSLDEGTEIFDYVESQCEITSVGVTPLYAKEGYLFITQPPEKETAIFRYQMSIFEDSHELFRSLRTVYIDTLWRSALVTYEHMKLDLVQEHRELPNPATYLVVSRKKFPFVRTLMPVVKRAFIKHLSKAA